MSEIVLRGLGWDHPRCMGPLLACGQAWAANGNGRIKWEARSLRDFGDQPLAEVAAGYDLLVVDHPLCGSAAQSACLLPLEDLLDDARALERLEMIGPSRDSYRHGGHLWGLAVDAAAQVSAARAGALDGAEPADWPAAVALVRTLAGRAALPLAPAHAISSLLTLWAAGGLEPAAGEQLVDPEAALEAVAWLVEMYRHGPPEATAWEPPEVLDRLSRGRLDYVPLVYGYVSYSGPCRFFDIPGRSGGVLGGAGLAVSASSRAPTEAARFALWVCSDEVQRSLVATHGGQPASSACWTDAEIDIAAAGFYSGTRATLEQAWVRPREPWWPAFQLRAGRAVSTGLAEHEAPGQLLEVLLTLYDDIVQRSGASV